MSKLATEYNGVKIEYSERFDRWEGTKDGKTIEAASLSELKKKLDRAAKAKVDRLPIYYPRGNEIYKGEITSYDGHKPRISWETGSGVDRTTVYTSDILDYTDENMQLFNEIKPLKAQRDALQSQIYALEKKYQRKVVEQHADRARKAARGELVDE